MRHSAATWSGKTSEVPRIPLWGGGCGKLARDLVRIGVCVNR